MLSPHLGRSGSLAVNQIDGPRPNECQHGGKHVRMDEKIATLDVKSSHSADQGIYGCRDQTRCELWQSGTVEALDERCSEEQHRNIIRELGGLAQSCVEEERANADDEERCGHEIDFVVATSCISERKVHYAATNLINSTVQQNAVRVGAMRAIDKTYYRQDCSAN